MTLNADELKELRAKAELATAGPWFLRTNRHTSTSGNDWGWLDTFPPGGRQQPPEGVRVTWESGQQSQTNAAFIAALNPATALSLITAAELNAELVEGLEAAREAVHPLLSQSEDNIWRRAKIVVDLADALIAKAKGQSNPDAALSDGGE